MEEKNLLKQEEDLIHEKIPLSENARLNKEYNNIRDEFSLPDYGIEIEIYKQKQQEQETNSTEKQYQQEKVDLQKMNEDGIIILREDSCYSDFPEEEDINRIINLREKHKKNQ